MPCFACAAARQLFYNWALWLDKTGNTILLGSPNETISARTARARDAGERWAAVFCRILTFCANTMSLRQTDHCTWSEGASSIAKEIWHWSPPSSPEA